MNLRNRNQRLKAYLNSLRGKMDPWKIITRKCCCSVFYGVSTNLSYVIYHLFILVTEKVELVKEIVVNLAHDVENRGNNSAYKWTSLPVEKFFQTDRAASEVCELLPSSFLWLHLAVLQYVAKKRYSMLFSEPNPKEE